MYKDRCCCFANPYQVQVQIGTQVQSTDRELSCERADASPEERNQLRDQPSGRQHGARDQEIFAPGAAT